MGKVLERYGTGTGRGFGEVELYFYGDDKGFGEELVYGTRTQ